LGEQTVCMTWPPSVERNDQTDEEFMCHVAWKWRVAARERLTIIRWGEQSMTSEHHCFNQTLLGQSVGFRYELVNWVTFDYIDKSCLHAVLQRVKGVWWSKWKGRTARSEINDCSLRLLPTCLSSSDWAKPYQRPHIGRVIRVPSFVRLIIKFICLDLDAISQVLPLLHTILVTDVTQRSFPELDAI
jgi:hypothetical protein